MIKIIKKFKSHYVQNDGVELQIEKNTNYDIKQIGNNYYMNEFSAAIGLVQLKKLDKLNTIRRKIARRYSQEIKINSKMQFDKHCSYHLYWILVKNRNEFQKRMNEHGIETGNALQTNPYI